MDKELECISFGYKIDGTPISVDYWNGDQASNRFHFLTHAHHHSMIGLTPSWRRPIYCSPITAKIAAAIQELRSESFITIDIGQTVLIDCDKIDGFEKKSFNVTALEASHCPGSTMFLFDGWFGRVLATGAFRFEDEYQFDMQRLCEKAIDHLYLDMNNWKRESIQGRLWSTIRALEIIASKKPNEKIILVTPECAVGQEQILVKIAENFAETIAVSGHRLRILREIQDDLSMFTDDPQQTRFRLINGTKGQIIRALKDELESGQSVTVVIFATPSDLSKWESIRRSDNEKYFELNQCTHFIPYTDHSTKEELERFLHPLTIRRLHFIGGLVDEDEANEIRRRFEKREDEQVDIDHANADIIEPTSSVADRSSKETEAIESETPTRDAGQNESHLDPCPNTPVSGMDKSMEDQPPEDPPIVAASSDDNNDFLFNESTNMTITEMEFNAIITWKRISQNSTSM